MKYGGTFDQGRGSKSELGSDHRDESSADCAASIHRTTAWRNLYSTQKLGFGSQLVADVPRLQLAAKAAVDYAKDGLRWRLAAPASNVLAIG